MWYKFLVGNDKIISFYNELEKRYKQLMELL